MTLVYVAACFAAAYLLWGPPRRRGLVSCVLAVCAVGLLVSQNRNMLIGLAAAVVFTGLLARRRGRVAAALAIASLAVLVTLAVARGSPDLRDSSVVGRVLSLTAPSQLESSGTVTARLRENSFALKALSASPIEGLGWAVPFGLADTRWQDGEVRTEDQLFVHNQYLLVWLRAGLLGLAGLLAALVLSVIYGARWLRGREEAEAAWLGAAVVVSVTAIAMSSLVGIFVVNPSSAPILAGVVALAAVLQRDLMRAT
jgi:O-antigen ligase